MTNPMLAELDEVVPGELDASAPSVIWLQLDTDGDNDRRDESWAGRDGVTWCDESIGGLEIQYVRADLYRDMAKRLEAAERDAARYRWLRMNCVDHWEDKMSGEPRGCSFNFEGPTHDVDADIDAAIAATQEGEG